jgi:hypothetical protein
MSFRVYRRHNREKCDSKNPYDPRCGCPLSVQFGWARADAVFEGKKLTSPQAKWSLGTRSWSEAQSKVTALEKRLKDFTDGKVVPKGMTVGAIQSRLFDLLPVVREHVYHPAFAGSYSIKSVLPALVPEMTYDGMEVANGQAAGGAWESLVRGEVGCDERDRLRKALLDYCGQDTLAMVRLLDRLRMLAG